MAEIVVLDPKNVCDFLPATPEVLGIHGFAPSGVVVKELLHIGVDCEDNADHKSHALLDELCQLLYVETEDELIAQKLLVSVGNAQRDFEIADEAFWDSGHDAGDCEPSPPRGQASVHFLM